MRMLSMKFIKNWDLNKVGAKSVLSLKDSRISLDKRYVIYDVLPVMSTHVESVMGMVRII